MLRAASAFTLLSQAQSVTRLQIEASGMTFDCGTAGDGSNGNVLLVHGNEPVMAERFFGMMDYLSTKGLRSVACDMRGHSPGASPQNYEAYNYDELAKDIFGIADASGFDKFHIVSHDQGARLTWHTLATTSAARERYQSFVTISIPHTDVFSDSLVGPLADPVQQDGFQYMTVLTLNTPESLKKSVEIMWAYPEPVDKIERRTFWYKGGVDAGNLALPPKDADKYPDFPHSAPEYGDDGTPCRHRAGHVAMPVTYICGDIDNCGKGYPFSARTKALCDGAYTYVELPSCRHDIMPCDMMDNMTTNDAICEGDACGLYADSGHKVWDAIMGNIALASVAVV